MAGGRRTTTGNQRLLLLAAMEPRPDGRGKRWPCVWKRTGLTPPQWSPGLMAGGRQTPKLATA